MEVVKILSSSQKKIHRKIWKLVRHYWEPNAVFGHGIDHAYRTYNHGIYLSEKESADALSVGAACYLMDIGLNPFQGRQNHIQRSLCIARKILVNIPEISHVKKLVMDAIKYHEAEIEVSENCLIEIKVVRDSDTLDRIGLTGIRMTLTYGIWASRSLYAPHDPFALRRSLDPNSYTLDYILYQVTLAHSLLTESSKLIGSKKSKEMQLYCDAFNKLYHERCVITYDDAFSLAEKL